MILTEGVKGVEDVDSGEPITIACELHAGEVRREEGNGWWKCLAQV